MRGFRAMASMQTTLAPPEPDLTPGVIVQRAQAMRSALRERQDETEHLTHPPDASHQAFLDGGFYRTTQPRRFGGYEFPLRTFAQVVAEIARGCPSTGWNFCLAGGHAVTLAAHFSEQAQCELFGPDGDFRSPLTAASPGVCTRTESGWRVNGRWTYASGITAANRFMGVALLEEGDGERRPGIVCLPEGWQVLDDWGAQIGMRGSGSNSVLVEDVEIPSHYVADVDLQHLDLENATPGGRLHGNGLYAGQTLSYFNCELVSVMVGCAWAAIDEHRDIVSTSKMPLPPFQPRRDVGEHQRTLGLAWGLVDAAERILLSCCDAYEFYGQRGLDGGDPFSLFDDQKLSVTLRQAGQMAVEAIELVAAASGSSALADGRRMQRYLRDAALYKTHINAQHGFWATELGAGLLAS